MNPTEANGSEKPAPDRLQAAPPPLQPPCRKCGRGIDGGDLYCKHCGAPQYVSDPWYYHPVSILLLALLVLGPFALPLLWRAQAMDRTVKIVLAIIITAYSALCLYLAYELFVNIYRHFSLLNDVMNR